MANNPTESIILADDEYITRKINKRMLEEVLGVKVDEVENGKELVEKVRAQNYLIILTDYRMPEMNGLEAIREIRKFNKTIPIYLLSAQDISDSQLNGWAYFIKKPLESNQIKEMLKYA